MICEECKTRPATLHFTKIVNGEKTETHICEQCAQEQGHSAMFFSSGNNFSFHNLLSGLLHADHSQFIEKKANQPAAEYTMQCPHCHMTYQRFSKLGRFGCARCYETFQSQLNPILKRLHSGNTVHHGKIPKRMGGNLHLRKELDELKQQLLQYIQQEEFEKAAEARDTIRQIEKQLSDHRKED
ncbi:UvrB/UvrC motif-containing protein [Ectobacillus ponti]|uniref:UvrB/UvrC motif-containing protein n=1 Tax=Ectobacillus ponti TaxID=2961894 RepID=A0AA42BS71_9BACI|nr:UvrB/UvrC motif-containing protein [Ectobacillus ponti]MCP8971081.1 UvrB/UvrC motif-containing protein [Ectobacillus ponti]